LNLLIKNANVISFSNSFSGDIFIKDGIIEETGKNLNYDCECIDASGATVMPSFIDLHSHFRDPGFTYKEDIESGSQAAASGGYTCVNLMANTKPVCSDMKTVDYVLRKAEEVNLTDIFQTVSITRDFSGNDLSHLYDIDEKKVRIISDDGFGVDDDSVMEKALRIAKEKDFIISVHEEYSGKFKLDSRESEYRMTLRDIRLNSKIGARLHIAHVSTKEAMEYIIKAKDEGIQVTCEVTPHHLMMTDDTDYSLHPPFRKKTDVEFLKYSLKKGYIDAIATDHAPHSYEDKCKGARGISGIETAYAICYTVLVKSGLIDLCRLSELMSAKPAEMLGVKKGDIRKGYDADLIFVDNNLEYEINADDFKSRGKNTPLEGMSFYGKVLKTFKKGILIYGG